MMARRRVLPAIFLERQDVMKFAYFDCFAGISGDMAVGALIDAGVPLDVVREALALLGPDVAALRVGTRPIVRSQIHAVKFDVLRPGGEPIDRMPAAHEHGHHHDHPHDHGHAHPHEHGHSHAQDHGHSHAHEHGHPHEHGHEGEHHHRTHADIAAMIELSGLADGVKRRALAIFRAIAVGEARVHEVPVHDVHFHEVGALDSIADIVAVAACLEHLGVERVYSSAVPLGGGGFVRTQHGVMPLPAPATIEILKGYPVLLTDVPFELTTPTGAGIIGALSSGVMTSHRFAAERIGFGAGTRELPDRPNLLRVVIGSMDAEHAADTVTVIEANVDDMNPQVHPYVMERLLAAGALDAYLTPVIMKKGRPGTLLTVIAAEGTAERLIGIIFAETTTIGLRTTEARRAKLERESIVMPTSFGPVHVKRIHGAEGERLAPEYEDARRIALEHGLPLRDVLARLIEEVRHATEKPSDRSDDE